MADDSDEGEYKVAKLQDARRWHTMKRAAVVVLAFLAIVIVSWGIWIAFLPDELWLAVKIEPVSGTHLPSIPWVFRMTHPLGPAFLLRTKWEEAHQNPGFSEWLVALGFVLGGLLGVIVLWKVPQWQVDRVHGLSSEERFDKRNEARKTLATVLGGVAFLTGGYFTWRNFILAYEGQITDRYTKAIAQLGDPKLEVRLGGIYSLEAIANESQSFHWPIMEVLTAYVRENAPVVPKKSRTQGAPLVEGGSRRTSAPSTAKHPSADIQAIINVIGNRKRKYEKFFQYPDLSGTNLRGADLHEAHFEAVDFSGANLSSAVLEGAYLRGAHLNCANLSMTDFEDAHINGVWLIEADLSSAKNLTQEQIKSAIGDRRTTKLPPDKRLPTDWGNFEVERPCTPPK